MLTSSCNTNYPQAAHIRLRAVPLRSVTSKFGRTGDSELTERGTGERREEEEKSSPTLLVSRTALCEMRTETTL